MPLIILLVALLFPRLGVVLLWLFTNFFASIALVWVILGLIFAPLTLLWVAAVSVWFGGDWGLLQILVLVLAIAYDFGGSGYGWSSWSSAPERHVEPEHHS